MKPTLFYFTLTLMGCLLLRMTPAAQGFMALEHEDGWRPTIMVDKVHEPHWDIAYSYGDDCLPEDKVNDQALTAAVTDALQIWLQPLRDYAQRPIVNDFRYHLDADREIADFQVVFYCEKGTSWASVPQDAPPRIRLFRGMQVTLEFMVSLVHEMGHIFGLADTYLWADRWGDPELDKGGSNNSKGTQPFSIMLGTTNYKDGGLLGRDDKNGIVWLYKVTYEGLGIRECFFPDYRLEEKPLGCVPKYSLIFALKHGVEVDAILVLKDDEGLDVNAQDAAGMTALHYAVLYRYKWVVEVLLARADIKPFLKNKDGQRPLQLAEAKGHKEIAALILTHPKARAVDPKRTLTTSWGVLKTIK